MIILSGDFISVIKSLQEFINIIFASRQDILFFDREKALMIRKCIGEYIASLYKNNNKQRSLTSNIMNIKEKSISLDPTSTLFSTVILFLSTTLVDLSFNKNIKTIVKKASKPLNIKKSYVQVLKLNISSNIEDVLQVKKAFSTLLADKVGKMLKVKNSRKDKKKPKINMTTKELSRKKVIIPITELSTELIISSVHIHISNINKCLKNSKLDIIVDFIYLTNNGIIITTNKPANMFDLATIKIFLKNIDNINSDLIEDSRTTRNKII